MLQSGKRTIDMQKRLSKVCIPLSVASAQMDTESNWTSKTSLSVFHIKMLMDFLSLDNM